MKNLIFFFLFGLIVACGRSDDRDNSDEVLLGFSLDTVMVNPGQEILFLNSGLHRSKLSPDKKYLYNFNQTDFSIEKINLDELKFEDKIMISKEGPNGVGQYFIEFLILDENSILFRGYNEDNILDWEGNKKGQFDFMKVGKESDRIGEGEQLYMATIQPEQPEVYYGLISNWQEKSTSMAVLDLANDEIKRFDLPLFEKTKAFEIEFNDGQTGFHLGTTKYVSNAGGKVIIGADVSGELFVYDPQTEEMQHFSYVSALTANEKTGKYPNQVGDQKELAGIYKKIQEEIGFNAVVWDDQKELYYRFSSMAEFSDPGELPKNQVIPSPTGAKVFLTIFDKDLNQIAESRVPMLTKKPAYHFVKDGKIWMFENIEDEMGFVQLSFDL